jgi:hypothetical protein
MKKAVVLCSMDGYANSVKPEQIKILLERHGYSVNLFSTNTLSRFSNYGWRRFLPYPKWNHIKLFFLEGIYMVALKQGNLTVKKMISSFALIRILPLRGKILRNKILSEKYDLLICETNFDEAIVEGRVATIQILDLPSPLAEELLYGGELNQDTFDRIKLFEQSLYAKADYISFHWHTYADFVKHNKYNGENFIDIGYGVSPKKARAHFSKNAKIAFLGYLGGYWINTKLLEDLSGIFLNIDVWGGPQLNLDINFKGYAPTSDVLADYQFGLITITNDPLRRSSFSSKHLEYFSYGLPVLVPEWRRDDVLDGGSIYYNAKNFVSVINAYMDEAKWNEKSKAALAIAERLTWERALQPLASILKL